MFSRVFSERHDVSDPSKSCDFLDFQKIAIYWMFQKILTFGVFENRDLSDCSKNHDFSIVFVAQAFMAALLLLLLCRCCSRLPRALLWSLRLEQRELIGPRGPRLCKAL